MLREHAHRQVQQLAGALVELAYAPICIHQHDALADTAECRLQQLGVLLQLGVEGSQIAFGSFAFGDIGVGANHAQGRAVGVPLDHRAPRQNPLPTAIFAAYTDVLGIGWDQPCHVVACVSLDAWQIVRMHTVHKVPIALCQFAGLVAQHFFPARGMCLRIGDQIPVPHPYSGAFQRLLPRVFFVSG